MRLGFLLIAAGLLSLLGLGCFWLRPALQERGGGGAANCTVLAVRQLGERFACTFSCGAACRGTARYPCLQVLVRTSRSAAPALLHEDERQLRTNPKVSAGRAPLGAALGGWGRGGCGQQRVAPRWKFPRCLSTSAPARGNRWKSCSLRPAGTRRSFFRGGRSICLLMPSEAEVPLSRFQKTPHLPPPRPRRAQDGVAEPRQGGLGAGSGPAAPRLPQRCGRAARPRSGCRFLALRWLCRHAAGVGEKSAGREAGR